MLTYLVALILLIAFSIWIRDNYVLYKNRNRVFLKDCDRWCEVKPVEPSNELEKILQYALDNFNELAKPSGHGVPLLPRFSMDIGGSELIYKAHSSTYSHYDVALIWIDNYKLKYWEVDPYFVDALYQKAEEHDIDREYEKVKREVKERKERFKRIVEDIGG